MTHKALIRKLQISCLGLDPIDPLQLLVDDVIEALAQTQEPVAWMDADGNVSDNNDHKCFPIPLYTHPPQRTWVDLTEDEAFACQGRDYFETYKAIAAKLKEKNT